MSAGPTQTARLTMSAALIAGFGTLLVAVVAGVVVDVSSGHSVTSNALATYSEGLRAHWYIGFCVLVSPWPLLLLERPESIRSRRFVRTGGVIWFVSASLLVMGLGEPGDSRSIDALLNASFITNLKQWLILWTLGGSLLALLGGQAWGERGNRNVAGLVQAGLVLATLVVSLGAWILPISGHSELLGIGAYHPLLGAWIGLWAFPVCAAAVLLWRRWRGPAKLAAVFAIGTCGTGLAVSLWALSKPEAFVLFDRQQRPGHCSPSRYLRLAVYDFGRWSGRVSRSRF